MFLQNRRRNRCEPFPEFTFRIVQTPEDSCVNRTRLDTGRRFVPLESVVAPGAFVSIPGVGIDEANAVRTGLNTVGAANAAVRVDQFDPLW